MIFVTLGSQKFQFNRLLKEIDRLIEENKINEEVFAQIGYSDYKPKNYRYKKFLDRDEYSIIISKADKVITHGGTGAIISAVKQDKKVIAVPRLGKYGEHVDDHQLQIVEEFKKLDMIECTLEINELEKSINLLKNCEFKKYISNTEKIINSIEAFLESK